jgi:hypothetical protein
LQKAPPRTPPQKLSHYIENRVQCVIVLPTDSHCTSFVFIPEGFGKGYGETFLQKGFPVYISYFFTNVISSSN